MRDVLSHSVVLNDNRDNRDNFFLGNFCFKDNRDNFLCVRENKTST
mgnify:CR=1 FL=1